MLFQRRDGLFRHALTEELLHGGRLETAPVPGPYRHAVQHILPSSRHGGGHRHHRKCHRTPVQGAQRGFTGLPIKKHGARCRRRRPESHHRPGPRFVRLRSACRSGWLLYSMWMVTKRRNRKDISRSIFSSLR